MGRRRWHPFSSFVFWALASIGAAVLLVAETPLANWAAESLEIYAPLERADAIVVLGGGVRFDGEVLEPTLGRLVYALRLFRKGYAPVVILTGGNPAMPELAESEAMERVALELGFSPEDFVVETRAKRTSEQARAVAQILRARQMESVILVTSPTHSYRALRAFRKAGLRVVPGTTDPLRQPPPPSAWWDGWFTVNPGVILRRLSVTASVLYEYAALALYWWNGWI